MRLILMRGVSGSGKSTLAKQLAEMTGGTIHSTDDFFMRDGKYIFDPAKIGEYHKRNQDACEASMKDGVNVVIIDNTNLAKWEMIPYVRMAQIYGYTVEIAEPEEVPFDEIMRRQSLRESEGKALSEEIVRRMIAKKETVTVEELLQG